MLLSHQKKFIFTKTAKTAGTSVEMYFEPYCLSDTATPLKEAREEFVGESGIVGYRGSNPNGAAYYNHMSAQTIRDLVEPEVWDSYFKFTVIRNPYDKMVSGFFHFEKSRNLGKYLNDHKSEVERFREWIANGAKIIDRDKYVIKGKIALDYFIRFESLSDGVKEVCDKLNIPFDFGAFPKTKVQHRDRSLTVSEFYDDKTADTVRKMFEFEIEHFGYELE